jgi:HK97 family phage major capsid protein
MVFAVEDAVIEGTGAGQPLGILNAGCLVSVAKETGQAATTIISENIIKMWARLHPSFKKNAVWLINPDVGPQLDHLTIPAGTGGVKPDYIMYGADGTWRIKGKPVIEVEYASTLGTVGDIILADFSQYYLATKGGVQAASSAHVRFLYDEMTFRFSYRVDGQPKFASALTPLKGSNTLAPFVVVATRA